jgi:hypothetical protein
VTVAERVSAIAVALCVCAWLIWNSVVGEAPVASFVAAAHNVPPHSRVVVQPPWRTDVEAALTAAGVDASTTLNPTAGEAFPNVVVLADRRWPVPVGWRVLQTHADAGDVVRWSR